jgi:hypothetical protein
MAKKILLVQQSFYRFLLKSVNFAITLVLALVCYVTGQVPKSQEHDSDSDSKSNAKASFLARISAAFDDPAPLYGVEPLYGPVMEYGMPYARFVFNGSVFSAVDSLPVKGANITLTDPATKEVLASTVSDKDGAFLLESAQSPDEENSWLISAGATSFAALDTLVNISMDSLDNDTADSSAWNVGMSVKTIVLYLKKNSSAIKQQNTNSSLLPSLSITQTSSRIADMAFLLKTSGIVRIGIYDVTGRLVSEVVHASFAGGKHIIPVDISCLGSGAYFFRLDSGNFSRITRTILKR